MQISINSGANFYARSVADNWNAVLHGAATDAKEKTAISDADKACIESATTTLIDVAAQLYSAGVSDTGAPMSKSDMSDILTSAYPSQASVITSINDSDSRAFSTTALRDVVAKLYASFSSASNDSGMTDVLTSTYSAEA
jgi:hypothetical protein